MVSDLNSFLAKSKSPNSKIEKICDLIVSKEQTLISSITQLYAIEGFNQPISTSALSESNIVQYPSDRVKNIILDLRGTPEDNQPTEVNQILTLLDINVTLIVLSDINSITLQNQIYKQGAVYALWDKALNGLNMAIRSQSDLAKQGLSSIRSAKRILVLGTKGGVGVSTFSSVLSSALSTHAHLKVLLVDHDASALCSDIYLGIKNLKLKSGSQDLTQIDIDTVIAEGYVHRAQDKLDYLALDRTFIQTKQHTELLYQLSNELLSNYNFIIDSVPLSAFESLNLPEYCDRYHRIFIICDPSVVSLRAHNAIGKMLGNVKRDVVFNLNRPTKDYLMSVNSAKERIKATTTINIDYEIGMEKTVLQQGIQSVMKKKYLTAITEVVADLTGKNIKPKSTFSLFKK